MHFTGTQFSPYILLLLKFKKCLARMEAIKLMQCIIMENTLIKLTLHDKGNKLFGKAFFRMRAKSENNTIFGKVLVRIRAKTEKNTLFSRT